MQGQVDGAQSGASFSGKLAASGMTQDSSECQLAGERIVIKCANPRITSVGAYHRLGLTLEDNEEGVSNAIFCARSEKNKECTSC